MVAARFCPWVVERGYVLTFFVGLATVTIINWAIDWVFWVTMGLDALNEGDISFHPLGTDPN